MLKTVFAAILIFLWKLDLFAPPLLSQFNAYTDIYTVYIIYIKFYFN